MACPALSQGSLAVARCSNALLFAALLCCGQAPRLNPCESKRRNAELVCVNTLGLKKTVAILKKTQPHAVAAPYSLNVTLKERNPSRRPVRREAHPQRERDVAREDRVRDRDLRVVRDEGRQGLVEVRPSCRFERLRLPQV